jgi:hypothetical protein
MFYKWQRRTPNQSLRISLRPGRAGELETQVDASDRGRQFGVRQHDGRILVKTWSDNVILVMNISTGNTGEGVSIETSATNCILTINISIGNTGQSTDLSTIRYEANSITS